MIGSYLYAHVTYKKCSNPGFQIYTKYSLFFGRNNIHNEEVVIDDLWKNFLSSTITPFFPDGLTVYDAIEPLKVQGAFIKERTKVVMILVEHGNSKDLANIHRIVNQYRVNFNPSKAFITRQEVCASFFQE